MQRDARPDATGRGRYRLVWGVLLDVVDRVAPSGQPAQVLDCGGGSGTFAVPLAEAGAHVTVVDVSADALATLRRRAEERGVADRIRAVQGDVETVDDAVTAGGRRGGAGFDLILAHGVLEAVDSVPAAMTAMLRMLRPGGVLSVLVANPVAAVLARAVAGDLSGALADLRALDASLATPGPATVRELCHQHGLLVEQVHGVGVFSEIVPGAALDAPGATADLAALESESAARQPFRDIAARVHVVARRPG